MRDLGTMALWWKVATVALVLSVVFFFASSTVADPDLWGHVRFGQDILTSGSIPSEDSYSYLSDREWVNHEWLSEVLFALAYDHAGPAGLIGLKATVTLALFALLYWHFCARGLGVFRGGMLLLLVFLPTTVGLGTVRPQLFTYLGFGGLLMILHATERGRSRALWAAPLLLALWANLHGGFVAGTGVLLVWLALGYLAALRERPSPSQAMSPVRLRTAGVVALACLATLLNPYGVHLWTFLWKTLTPPRPEIMEWQPIKVVSGDGAMYVLLVALALSALLRSRRPRRPALIGVLACTAVLPLQALRHWPLFAIAFGVLTAEHLADAMERSWPRDGAARSDALQIGFTSLALTGALVLILAARPRFSCIRIEPRPGLNMPVRAVALLKESGVRGNLAVFFDWGEYAIWHLAPDIRISVDGRRETVYSPQTLRENQAFHLGTGDWDAVLDEHPTDLVLVNKVQPFYNLMRLKPGWSLAHEDSLGALFVREASPAQRALRRTPVPDVPSDGRGLCFP